MIHDFLTYENGAEIDTDICVIGAGAAGIAIAREFLTSSVRVLLVESGGLNQEPATDSLSQGENVGLPHYGLVEGRSRLFGGTTRLWAGQCTPLDDIDFEARPWVPYSGWPINKTELAPHYQRAEDLFYISNQIYNEKIWQKFAIQPPDIDKSKLGYKFTVYTPTPDLGKTYRDELKKSPNVQVLLHANVTKIQSNESRSQVEYVNISTLEGKTGRISAKAFVLCCGGIENARLLLLSDGLGNDRDLVGRFFQEHPNCDSADVKTPTPLSIQEPYGLLFKGKFGYFPKIHLSPDFQRQQQLLNCTSNFVFELDVNSGVGVAQKIYRSLKKGKLPAKELIKDSRHLVAEMGNVTSMLYRRYVRGRSAASPPVRIWLQTHGEQAPNRDSRITLSSDRDALGLNTAQVDWRLTDLDRRTAETTAKTMEAEFARLNLAQVNVRDWLTNEPSDWATNFHDSYHHMGTTRMAADLNSGVVDSNCQVHGVAKLFIAGSSVFTTSGYSNPTLTIVALAIRLADHLKKTVTNGGSLLLNQPH